MNKWWRIGLGVGAMTLGAVAADRYVRKKYDTGLVPYLTDRSESFFSPGTVLYDKLATPYLSDIYRQVAGDVLDRLETGAVLDVGAGPGQLLMVLAQRGPGLRLWGLDSSRGMVKLARRHLRHRMPGASVEIVEGNVMDIPFADGSFDLIVSTLSLHHWPAPAVAFLELTRVLRPGGVAWLYDFNAEMPRSVFNPVLHRLPRWARPLFLRHEGPWSVGLPRERILGAARAAGVRAEVVPYETTFLGLRAPFLNRVVVRRPEDNTYDDTVREYTPLAELIGAR